MVTYKAGIEFGSNVGVLSRDLQTAAQATRGFGTEASASLGKAAAAVDELQLAQSRMLAAQTGWLAAGERLNAVTASGTASLREQAAAQNAAVAATERLQRAQAGLLTAQERAARPAAAAGHGAVGGIVGLTAGLVATEGAIKIKDAVEEGAKAAANLQAINRQMAATLTSTGNVAGTSVEGIDRMTESISRQTGITDEAARGGALLELTFTGIRNEGGGAAAVFDRAQTAAANMAIALHLARGGAVDYQGAMQLLGRALNNPIAGMTNLQRAGVSFTASQKAQIETLAKSGDMLGAQEQILTLLGQKFGNAASIYGGTAEGAYARVRESLNQLEQQLASPLLAEAPPILDALRATLGFFVDHPATLVIGETATALVGLAFALATVERGMRFLRESEWATALLRMVFPVGTLGRALGTIGVEEDTVAAAGERAAVSQNTLAGAMERAGGAAAVATPQVAALDVAETVGTPLAAGSRLGTVGKVVGAGALAFGGYELGNVAVNRSEQLKGRSTLQNVSSVAGTALGTAAQGAAIGGAIGMVGLPIPVVGEVTTGAGAVIGGTVGLGAGLIRGVTHVMSSPSSKKNSAQTVDDLLKQAGLDPASQQKQADQQALATIYGGFDITGGAPSEKVDTSQLHATATTARGQATAAADAVVRAMRAVTAARQAAGTAATRTSAQILAAEDRLARARSAKNYDPTAVAAAEARLASLRAGNGAAGATRLANAEDALRLAQQRSAKASSDAVTAEHKAATARTTTALTVNDVLKRVTGQQRYQHSIGRDLSEIALGGVSSDALAALEGFEKQAPGTIHNFAEHLTKRTVTELNAQFRGLHADAATINKALTPGFADGLTKAAIDGVAAAQATITKLAPSIFASLGPDAARALAITKGNVPTPHLDAFGTAVYGPALAPPVRVEQPQVVVHVHTSAPQVTHQTNVGEVKAHDYNDFTQQLRRRQRLQRASL